MGLRALAATTATILLAAVSTARAETTLTDRDGQQSRHDRDAEVLDEVREAQTGDQAEVAGPRRERAAPARDDRHLNQGRPVRHHHHRPVRDADVGQGRLARPVRQLANELRRRRHAAEPVRNGLSYEGKLYSVPFYAESAMTYYRTDLFKKAGLTMPEKPTWDQIAEFADKVNDQANGIYGICLRGLPGWGENMGLLGVVGQRLRRPALRHRLEVGR